MDITNEKKSEEAPDKIERGINKYEKEISLHRKKYIHKQIHVNLTPIQESLIKRLTEDRRYKVLRADNNCGLAVANTDSVIRQAIDEHLGDATVHNRLTKGEAHGQLSGVGRLVEAFIGK